MSDMIQRCSVISSLCFLGSVLSGDDFNGYEFAQSDNKCQHSPDYPINKSAHIKKYAATYPAYN